MKKEASEICPCGSGAAYSNCCEPPHQGIAATSPEALMRSRFSAFCKNLPHYLVETTHPNHYAMKMDPAALLQAYSDTCQNSTFTNLKIVAADESGETGSVQFEASCTVEGNISRFGEKSKFARVDERWTYLSGELYQPK